MDEILIAEAMHGQVRIHAAETTQLVEDARIAHQMYPTSCAALGRLLTGAALLASDLKKEDEKIVAAVNGHGPAGTLIAQARGNGDVRGLIGDPAIYISDPETGKLDVGKAVGKNGYLTITRDMGLKDPFTGTVKLVSGEIGDDLVYYLAMSEQINSAVSVGVLVNIADYSVRVAGGLIFQLLPNVTEETIEAVEKIVSEMKPVSVYLDQGMSPEEIIRELFADAVILDRRSVRWHCGCSYEHYRDALAVLKKEDLQEMIDDGKGAEIVCQYCHSKYVFTTEDLKEILERQSENR